MIKTEELKNGGWVAYLEGSGVTPLTKGSTSEEAAQRFEEYLELLQSQEATVVYKKR